MSGAPWRCPAFLRGYPGAVLQLSEHGTVLDSNGRLEPELGLELVGRDFESLLDPESSGAKWTRMLADAEADRGRTWELIFRTAAGPGEPRAFSVLREPNSAEAWLVEHPRDPRLEQLSRQVTEVNSDLSRTQRDLSKEKARLARALEELERRSEELERSNRELDAFAHVVSHDLKAPLRSIAGYATWIQEDAAERLGDEARAHIVMLLRRVEHMDALIHGILEYARAGREPAPAVPVDTGLLVREVAELLAPPPDFEIAVEGAFPVLVTDRMQLEQVFQNLIGNAIRYARAAQPRMRVGAAEAGEFWEFRVEDNGPGIPERLQERIFGIFFTGRASQSRDSTGIGLSIVKKVVERQGGRVWVESSMGEGSTFYFLWPSRPRSGPVQGPEGTTASRSLE